MMLTVSKLDLRSLLIVLFAFIGNAQVQGVDLVLATVAPFLLLISVGSLPRFTASNFILLLGLTATLLAAAIQAFYVDIPYFEAYELWPLKAFILMVLVAYGPPLRWAVANMVALSVIAFTLIAVGRIESGRLFSVFGPNMLYRLFGILALFSAMQRFQLAGGSKTLGFAAFGLGVFGLVLTGSTGAIGVFLVIGLIYLYHRSRKLFYTILIGLGMMVYFATAQVDFFAFFPDSNLAFVSRTLFKMGEIQTNSRLLGLSTLLSEPFALLGHTHADFNYLWFFGYDYPHNIFAELYVFYGFVGVILISVILLALVKAIKQAPASDVAFLTFIVLLIGSNLSGDLSDNYGVIGLAGGLLLRPHLAGQGSGRARRNSEQRDSNVELVS